MEKLERDELERCGVLYERLREELLLRVFISYVRRVEVLEPRLYERVRESVP